MKKRPFRLFASIAALLPSLLYAEVTVTPYILEDRSGNQQIDSIYSVQTPAAAAPGTGTFIAEVLADPVGYHLQPVIFNGSQIVARGFSTYSLMGSSAPGTNGAFSSFKRPFGNSAGQVAFQAQADGKNGIWMSDGVTLGLVALHGNLAPGTNANFSFSIDRQHLGAFNGAGKVAFAAFLEGASPGTGSGYWMGSPDNVTLIARGGSQAPGLAPGVVFSDNMIASTIVLNNLGQVAFFSDTNAVVPDQPGISLTTSLFSGAPDSLQLVATSGQRVPDTEMGIEMALSKSGQVPSLNVLGEVGFTATFYSRLVSANKTGSVVIAGAPGALRLLARTGEPAVGYSPDVKYLDFDTMALNDVGEAAFWAAAGVSSYDPSEAIYMGRAGQLRRIATSGEEAPGTLGANFTHFERKILLSNSGQVAFVGHLDSSGGTDTALFATDQAGVLQMIAREGSPLPGSPYNVDGIRIYPGDGGGFESSASNGDGRKVSIFEDGSLLFGVTLVDPDTYNRAAAYRATFSQSAPVILPEGQPLSVSALLGGTATFQVIALGERPAYYQWFHNGEEIFEANSSTLRVTDLTLDKSGAYTVMVTKDGNSVVSNPAQLSFPPIITVQPPARASFGSGAAASLSVEAEGPGTLSYQWQVKAFGTATFTDVQGSSSSPTLTFASITTAQTGIYRVQVSSAQGSATSTETRLSVSAVGQPIVEGLAYRGDRVPGFSDGVFLFGAESAVLNNTGKISFESGLINSAGSVYYQSNSVFSGVPGDFRYAYKQSFDANLSDTGEMTLVNYDALLYGTPGAISPLAVENEPAPGVDGTFEIAGDLTINSTGLPAFNTGIGFGRNNIAIYIGRPGNLQLVAQEGLPAPGLGAGVDFGVVGGIEGLSINSSAELVFAAFVTGTGITSDNDTGIWMKNADGLQRVVTEGASAPGAGANSFFGDFETYGGFDVHLNDAGEIAFSNVLTGSGTTAINDDVIYAGAPNALKLVARGGMAAGAGHIFALLADDYRAPLINATGQVTFVSYDQQTTTLGLVESLWRWTPGPGGGTRKLLAREGAPAPGCAAGVVFDNDDFLAFPSYAINASGQVLFQSYLAGPGVTNSNHYGLWLTTASGEPKLLLRAGQPFDIGGGDVRTMDNFRLLSNIRSGGQDGLPRVLSDSGTVVFTASFNDNSEDGLFRVTLPAATGGGANAPLATTNQPGGVTATSAKLKGSVNPKGVATTVYFEYGLTDTLGLTTAAENVSSGNTAVAVEVDLEALAPETMYFYRVVAASAGGTAEGATISFTTTSTGGGNQAPSGGSVLLSPAFGIIPSAPLTVTFAGWSDPERKKNALTYQVLVDGIATGPAGSSKTISFVAPSAGTYTLTARITDPLGASADVTSSFTVVAAPTAATQTMLFSKNGLLPPGTGAPAGSTWSTFGIPTTLANDEVGFLATIKHPAGTFSGIFGGPLTLPQLHLSTDETAPDEAGAPLNGATFASFREPVFTSGEEFATIATLRGVSKSADSGIWASSGGTLYRVAGESRPAAGLTGPTYNTFVSIGMAGESVFFTASLKGTDKASDLGLWVWNPTQGTRLILREGSDIDFGSGIFRKVRFLQALFTRAGVAGEPTVLTTSTALQLIFTNGDQAHGRALADGTIQIEAISGPLGLSGLVAKSYTLPDLLDDNTGFATFAIFSNKTKGIVTHDGVLAQTGTIAPGSGALFKAFGLPVIGSPASPVVAFTGALKGQSGGLGFPVSSSIDSGIWIQKGAAAPLELLTREGSIAPGTGGARFGSFTSLAILPGRGPIFTAKLATKSGIPKVSAKSDLGLWALSSTGALQLLVRETDLIGGKSLKTFHALLSVPGSPSQSRTFNAEQVLIYRAFFTDGTQALVKVDAP